MEFYHFQIGMCLAEQQSIDEMNSVQLTEVRKRIAYELGILPFMT